MLEPTDYPQLTANALRVLESRYLRKDEHGTKDRKYCRAPGIGQALARAIENGEARSAHGDNGHAAGANSYTRRRAEALAGSCPECGNELEFEGGCAVCRSCGYSRC